MPQPAQPTRQSSLLRTGLVTAVAALAIVLPGDRLLASFGAGHLALLVTIGTGNNVAANIVEIDAAAAVASPAIQTIPLPDTANTTDSYRTSASATSTAYVSLTSDRSLLVVTGHNSTNTVPNANTLTLRGVYTVSNAGTVVKQTTYTGGSGNQTRSATSLNNSNWFIADQGGLYTNGSVGASPSGNFRAAKAFGTVVYLGQASTTAIQVATISAPSSGTLTGLPGLTNNSALQDFYLIQSGSNGTTYDVLYVLSATSNTAGTITKYSLVSGSWISNGSYTTSFGGFGLAAAPGISSATLYVSTGQGALAANSVVKVTDTAGYNAAMNVVTANNVTLYTTAAGTIIKGLDFAPAGAAPSTPPDITTQPQSQVIVSGSTATLTVGATGTAPISYQWYRGNSADTSNPVGTNSPSYTTPALLATTSYWVRASNAVANDDSDTATITVTAPPSNTPPTIGPIPALAGVISDPTNPAVAFTVNDAETPANALTVSATATTNAAVAPLNKISIGGIGTNRTASVEPQGIGYADISIEVSDGTSTTSALLHYAASAASVTPITTRFHAGASDASTAVAVDADYMLVGDDENQGLRLFSRHTSGLPLKTFDFTASLGLPDTREVDIESSTRVGSRIYWLGSHGNGSAGQSRPSRYRLFATDLTNPGPDAELSYVGRYDNLRTDLIDWDNSNGHGFGAGYFGFTLGAAIGNNPEIPNGTGFNIEGLTVAPDNTTAYLAFRAPLVPPSHRADALIVPVLNFDLLLGAGGPGGPAQFGAPIVLDLGGRAIRSIERNGSGEYLIAAGPVAGDTGIAPNDFRLFTWTGEPTDAPVLHAANLTALLTAGSFESIVEVPASLAPSTAIQLLVDNGDTVFYGDAVIAKDLAEPNFKKSRSEWILLGDVATEPVPVTGSIPVVGDLIFNEYASDNDANGNDFFELLILRDNLDLRGLRVSDNELVAPAAGGSTTGEAVYVFGNQSYLANVPAGTIIAIWALTTGITPDTTVNPAGGDWKMVLVPGTGFAIATDGLSGTSPGLNAGGEALYLYLPGPDGNSGGTDNVYLDFMSYEDDLGSAPAGLVDINLPSNADNAYYVGNTASGNDFSANWVRLSDLSASVTPGEPNPTQDLSSIRAGGGATAGVTLVQSGGTTTVTEGGGSDSYTVALNTVPTGGVTIQATVGSQLELSTDNVTFGPTASLILTTAAPATFFVKAVDDGLVEGPTSASITHSITASGDASYSDALTPVQSVSVAITDNDIALVHIHDIQGSGATSPMAGTSVSTSGIVTGLKSNGFFLQEPDGGIDGDSFTSEGIFVFTSGAPTVAVGNLVQIGATVSEFIPSADPFQPPLTELTGPSVSLLSTGNSLPTATAITAAMTTAANATAILEGLEGMRVSVPSMTVAGPTLGTITETSATASSSGVFYGVVTGVTRPFREPGIDVLNPFPPGAPATIPRFDGNPERLRVDSDAQPGAAVLDVVAGTVITGMVGPLDYGFRTYTVLPDPGSASPGASASFTAVPVPSIQEVTVAGFNVERFFDDVNDPIGEPQLSVGAFQNRLNKASLAIRNVLRSPDVVGLIEVENLSTLQRLATKINTDSGAPAADQYTAYLSEGNDVGGIDVGFLVKNKVTVVSVHQEGLNTTFTDPTDGSTDLLNDRPPLVLDAEVPRPTGGTFAFSVVLNHLRSLNDVDADSGPSPAGPRVREKRRKQAEFVASLIQGMQTLGARVITIGDFNAFQFNDGYVDSMGTIQGTPTPADQVTLASADLVTPNLTNLATLLPASQQYSYVFDGSAQILDHALVSNGLASWVSRFGYARLDADFPETARNDPNTPVRISDHDPSITYLAIGLPKLSGRVLGQSPRAGGQMTVTLQISNTGGGNAQNVLIDQALFRTLTGSGNVSLAGPALPIALGPIGSGQSVNVVLTLSVPPTVTRFSLTANGGYAESAGTNYRFSFGLPVTP